MATCSDCLSSHCGAGRNCSTHPGEVVTRERLVEVLWPKGVVDFDSSLNAVVRKLRVVLGDDSETPRYIETLPRIGYRFIGKIERAGCIGRTSAPSCRLENRSRSGATSSRSLLAIFARRHRDALVACASTDPARPPPRRSHTPTPSRAARAINARMSSI